jgi:hypothetical protein
LTETIAPPPTHIALPNTPLDGGSCFLPALLVGYRCIHCGQVKPSLKSLHGHLGHCKDRNLTRFYKCGKYLFFVIWNPKRSKNDSMAKLLKNRGDAKLFIGALEYLELRKEITRFGAIEIENKELLKEENGKIVFYTIRAFSTRAYLKKINDAVATVKGIFPPIFLKGVGK